MLKKLTWSLSLLWLTILLLWWPSSVRAQSPLPQRIISLAPSISELIYSLHAEDRLIGVSRFDNYPPAIDTKPVVGDAYWVNPEQLLLLKPDLILLWSIPPYQQQIEHFSAAQIMIIHPQTLKQLLDDIRRLNRTLYGSQASSELADRLELLISDLKLKYQQRQPLKGFIFLSANPLMTLGAESIQSDALQVCGVENIFHDLPKNSAVVSVESIMTRQPDFIIISEEAETSTTIRTLHGLALDETRYIRVNPDIFYRPTERMVDSLPALCAQIDALRL